MMHTELAKELIENFGFLIETIFQDSLEIWFRTANAEGVEYKNRSKSTCLWDIVIHKLRSELATNADFHFIDKYGTTYIAYKQIFLIKVKKLGTDKRPSFIHTQRADKFQNQLDLGFGDYVNVYLCYSLDRNGITINSIRLQCENGRKILWSFLISDSTNTTSNDILFPETQRTEGSRIRLKKPLGEQDGKVIQQ